jgi:peptide chain release factor 1
MFEKLAFIEDKNRELEKQISDPAVISDTEKWQALCKEHADLAPLLAKYREYRKAADTIEEAKELLKSESDKDFREMLEEEMKTAQAKLEPLENEMKILMLPKDPNDEKNVIIEIRGGAGGDEAALFAADLFRMYSMYAETHRWKVEVLSSNATDIGGYKEISFMIEGKGAYSRLKFESGVHRVQRVPDTESAGRIHTSTVTVAVLPEAEEVELDISPNDLRIDVFRAGGPGGQCVNTTDSAVRITHIPTGLVVSCQDEKSQLKNKEKGMKILRSRLYDMLQQQKNDEIARERKSQVGRGNRNERIRTYNFPQSRLSDHRINFTSHRLEDVMNGALDEVMDALITADQSEKLKYSAEEE